PSWDGVSYGGKIRLNGVDIDKADNVVSEGDSLQVKLWWSEQAPVNLDYSMSLALLDESGRLIAQADGPASAPDTPQQTSRWQPSTYYDDTRSLKIPSGTQAGMYHLVVAVYQWWDNVRLVPADNPLWARVGLNQSYLEVATIQVPGP